MLKIDDILSGNHLAGARMIRLIEDRAPEARGFLKALYPFSGNAFIIGITGAPGVGKSTLIDALVAEFRKKDKKIGVIAIDPTSPFSGGAILGDRVRMQQHASDNNVFIRSMASRGQHGGLSRATHDAAVVLDAMGFNIIIIETVGAGQTEFDIASMAHTVGIVTIPGSGDGIQAVKAGILETGDLFIVNKCDLPDADACANQIESMLDMGRLSGTDWKPQVFKTIARQNHGVEELAQGFLTHFEFMKKDQRLNRKRQQLNTLYFKSLVRELSLEKIDESLNRSADYKSILERIKADEIDPLSAAQQMVTQICNF